MKFISHLLVALFFILILSEPVQAKVLPQAAKSNSGGTKTAVSKTAGTTIGVSPKLRKDKRALIVYFSNLQNAKSVSYSLIYTTNGQQEGAMGAINLTGASTASQELLFGTCSKNVCRYHPNIKDTRLEVSYTSKIGKKYLKKYKIKV